MIKLRFNCLYCEAEFEDFTSLVKHFEEKHRNTTEYVEIEVEEDIVDVTTKRIS